MNALAVFDLDGTLVETAPDLVDTTNVVLAAHGVPPIAFETLRPHIGLGARRMIAVSLAAAGRTMTEAELDAVHAAYLDHYATRLARLSHPYPEVPPALARLAAAGVGLAICTNKRESFARTLMAALGLGHRFPVIAGADTFAHMKPHPEHLLATVRAAGGDPARTVFVGDSTVDHATARAARIPFVGCTWGYTEVPVDHLAPDRIVRPGDDLAAAVLSLLPAPDAEGPGRLISPA